MELFFQILIHPPFILLGNTDILFSLQAKNLDITLSNNLSTEKACHDTNRFYREIWRISNIRHYLTLDAMKSLLCAPCPDIYITILVDWA